MTKPMNYTFMDCARSNLVYGLEKSFTETVKPILSMKIVINRLTPNGGIGILTEAVMALRNKEMYNMKHKDKDIVGGALGTKICIHSFRVKLL